jgi:hypothetical protein
VDNDKSSPYMEAFSQMHQKLEHLRALISTVKEAEGSEDNDRVYSCMELAEELVDRVQGDIFAFEKKEINAQKAEAANG